MTPRRPRLRLPGRTRVDEEVAREIESHLAFRQAELEAEGWDAAEARQEALRLFGSRQEIVDECSEIARSRERAVRRGEMMGSVWQDFRYGVRSLLASPGFAVVALLTLALGIGANTAIFSLVEGVLLAPLPYDEPHELVWIDEVAREGGTMDVAWPNFADWRDLSSGFRAMAAFGEATPTILGGSEPVQVPGAAVSRDFWTVFPVAPMAGRLTVPDDHREGAAPVIVVSRTLARDILGAADPAEVVGRVIRVQGSPFEVVGVVPGDFAFPAGAQHWSPLELNPLGDSRTAHNYSVVARLGSGTLASVEAPLDAFHARLAAEALPSDLDYLAREVAVTPLRDKLVGEARTPLFILLGAAAFVLLVACTNLASTLLARGTARAQELAVRSALGGSRLRLVRQLLVESLVLALAGAAAGVGVAAATLHVLKGLGGGAVPRLEAVEVDLPVLGFTLLVAVVTALAFGLFPALRATERVQSRTLRASRGQAGGRRRTWDLLVASEVALALILLAGSGLMVRSLAKVLAEDPGFDERDVVAAPVTLGQERYPELEDHVRFWDGLLDRVADIPGASAAGLFSVRPLTFLPSGRVALDGDPSRHGDAGYVVADAGAFEALDIPLLQGRLFQPTDGPDAPHVVVVSRSFAQRYWPGESPLGRQVSGGGMDDYWNADPVPFGTVVGVVDDVRFRSLEREGIPTVYWHYRQRPFRIRYGASLLVESDSGDPELVAGAVRAALREADPEVPVRVSYMADLLMDSVGRRRFLLFVLGGFAAVALALAGVGIYGVVSWAVARRTREMGVRLALGAEPASVRGLVLRGALRPVILGVGVGVAASFVGGRVLSDLLYDVAPSDPLTLATVSALLLGVAVVASWIPARRGTRVDPVQAMRAD